MKEPPRPWKFGKKKKWTSPPDVARKKNDRIGASEIAVIGRAHAHLRRARPCGEGSETKAAPIESAPKATGETTAKTAFAVI